MGNFNHSRENAFGVIHSPWLQRPVLLCSAYRARRSISRWYLESLLACLFKWLHCAQGPRLPVKLSRIWICVFGGEAHPSLIPEIKVVWHWSSSKFLSSRWISVIVKVLKTPSHKLWVLVILFPSVIFIGLTLVHITDSRYFGFSVSIYLSEGEWDKNRLRPDFLELNLEKFSFFLYYKKYCVQML